MALGAGVWYDAAGVLAPQWRRAGDGPRSSLLY